MPSYTTYTRAYTEPWKTWVGEAKEGYVTETSSVQETAWSKWQAFSKNTSNTTWNEMPQVRDERTPWERDRDELVARNRRHSRELRKRNAVRRAKKLLVAHLTPEQRAEWEEGSYFHVETANGRRRYRIDRGHVGNIRVVLCEEPPPVKADRVREGSKLCAHAYHPDGWIPDEDHMLAQKLLLESDGGEAELLRMANVVR